MPASVGDLDDALGRQRQVDAERLEHVRRARRRRRGPVAVLDEPHARGRGHHRGHRRDVDGVGAVAAGADDVEARARAPRCGARARASARPGPRISSMLSPLARRPMRKPATWEGVASPAMIWAMAHSAVARSRSRPGDEVGEQGGPGRRRPAPCVRPWARPSARAWRWPTSARSGRAGAGRPGRPATRRPASCPAGGP